MDHVLSSPDLLMVCLGNICRSPLAEGICRTLCDRHGLKLTVGSAGTGRWHVGEPPHRGSVEIASRFGIDISHQRSQHLSAFDLETITWVIVMDEQNQRDVIQAYPTLSRRSPPMHLIRQFEGSVSGAAPGRGVPDPYYGRGDDAFLEVYQILERSCQGLVTWLQTQV